MAKKQKVFETVAEAFEYAVELRQSANAADILIESDIQAETSVRVAERASRRAHGVGNVEDKGERVRKVTAEGGTYSLLCVGNTLEKAALKKLLEELNR